MSLRFSATRIMGTVLPVSSLQTARSWPRSPATERKRSSGIFRNRALLDRQILPAAAMLLAGVLTGVVCSSSIHAQTSPSGKPEVAAGRPSHYAPNPMSEHAVRYYRSVWGIDAITVKSAESGELIRFTYQVLDPDKAKPLNDKKNEPSLIDPRAGIKLVVPSLEKVGQLRQSSTPEAGKMYWMAFSNKGRLVKLGDRVNVVIGNFQANGLVVE
jgi:hypothetical protein